MTSQQAPQQKVASDQEYSKRESGKPTHTGAHTPGAEYNQGVSSEEASFDGAAACSANHASKPGESVKPGYRNAQDRTSSGEA